ncbi:MAG TPA: thiamine-phosphate kinase, partial [Epsilonproteobacteria bacterium]|nr:thiamine-phosphate kinase [Campylobacterota bacterium]
MNKEAYIIKQFPSAYNGDDGAIVGDMVYSMDGFYEGIHFKRSWMSMSQIGRKAMLVNISDAIAMNAIPQFALVTLALPDTLSEDEMLELTNSLNQSAKEFGCEIIGGDTLCDNKISISITIISKTKNPLFRKGLQEGDLLAYTGSLGGVKRDLDRLFRGEAIEVDSKFYEPILRQDFVKKASDFLRVGMDI